MSKPQRRKGNAQSANSSRAAEWLADSGGPAFGFPAGYTNPFEAAAAAASGDAWNLQSELDSEVVLVFKKLAKKDAHTREKALRDLIELLPSKSADTIQLAYDHFATLFDKLALDGSASVRSYSMRVAGYFLLTLKKDAQKQLKNILPYVIFAASDVSATVVQHSRKVFTENFPDQKRLQAISLFSGSVAKLCCGIIRNQHPLIAAQKYDAEEEESVRNGRLLAQSLQTLSMISSLLTSTPQVFSDEVKAVFTDTQTIKRILKQASNIKAALLTLSMRMDESSVNLNLPLVQWILQNLDSSDSDVATSCFDAFVQLASNEQFFNTFDVQKVVIPRILNVIRKKQIHYRAVAPLILPSISLVCDALSEEDRPKFICSLLYSFPDNLPFESGSLMEYWSNVLSECVKYSLSKWKPLHADVVDTCCKVLLQCVDIVCSESSVVFKPLVELIHWISEKEAFSDEMAPFLVQLTTNLINKRPVCDEFAVSLLAGCPSKLSVPFSLLARSRPVFISLLKELPSGDNDFVAVVDNHADLLPTITDDCSSNPSHSSKLAPVLLKALEALPQKSKKYQLSSGELASSVLAYANTSNWHSIEAAIGHDRESIIKDTLLKWRSSDSFSFSISLLSLLSDSERDVLLSFLLDSAQSENSRYFASLAAQLELSPVVGCSVSNFIIRAIFEGGSDGNADDLACFLPALLKYPISTEICEELRNDIGREGTCSANIECDAAIASVLCTSDTRFDSLLIDRKELEEILVQVDKYVSSEVLFSTCLASTAYSIDEPLNEEFSDFKWKELRRKVAAKGLFAIKTATQELASRQWSLVLAAVHLALYRLDAGCRRSFEDWDELEMRTAETFKTAVENDESLLSCVQSAMCSLSAPLPRIVLLAIKELSVYKAKVTIPSTLDDLPSRAELLWALSQNADALRVNTIDRWISRFHSTPSSFQYLTDIQEHVNTNNAEWEADMFNINASNGDLWRVNLCALRAAGNLMDEEEIADIEPQILDYAMCGLITALDSCDEYLCNNSTRTDSFNAFAALALRMFCTCLNKTRDEEDKEWVKEWKEFFYPTVSRIIIRWFLDEIKGDSPTDVFIRWLCTAASDFKKYNWELTCKPSFTPLLDAYKYSGEMQTAIVQCCELLQCGEYFREFAATNILRLISKEMYHQENGEWSDETEGGLEKAERKLKPPHMVAEIAKSSNSLPAILALDICISPLASISSHEERVGYCDGLIPIINHALPVLLSTCPQHIPRSREREYLVSPVLLQQPSTVDRYCCALLFKLVEFVPAIVRTWYTSLPKMPSQTVNKYFRDYISKISVDVELSKVRNASGDVGGSENSLKVRTLPVSGEVVAEYTVDETTMRLVVSMPQDWPLSVPQVTLDKAIVASERAKKWLLQLTAFLFHQNGSMIEGIVSWRSQVDRDVAGAEACCICMMTIHTTSHQLPRVKCKQCKNKFHSNCLYKWFESSNQSSCPLCRTNFT